MYWKLFSIAFLAVGAMGHSIPESTSNRAIERFNSAVSAYCQKNGAQDKIEEAKKAGRDYYNCLIEVIASGDNDLNADFNNAQGEGDFKPLVKKYCALGMRVKPCISNVVNSLSPCMEEQMRNYVPQALNATNDLFDYVCHNDGERIVQFIADDGIGCITRKKNSLVKCAESYDIHQESSLTIPERCGVARQVTSCVVKTLEECSSSTVSTMAENVFKYVLKSLPCANNDNTVAAV